MGRNEKKRQQAAMKKKQKEKLKKKKQAITAKTNPESVPVFGAGKVQQARRYPIFQCWINEGWEESGLATVLIIRRSPFEELFYGVYLIDIFCLGLKNTYSNFNFFASEASMLVDSVFRNQTPIPCSPALAHEIIYGGIDYAARLGFKPHKDFSSSRHILEPRETYPPSGQVEFGKDGKPFYIAGPKDNVQKIVRQLGLVVGEENFHFFHPMEPSPLLDSNGFEKFMNDPNRWNLDDVEAMSTGEIFQQLHEFGIETSEDLFRQVVEHSLNLDQVIDQWKSLFTVKAQGFDEDFLWMAVNVLWERLCPDVLNVHLLEEAIEKGDDFIEQENYVEACRIWYDAWEQLKDRLPPDILSVKDIENLLRSDIDLEVWFDDISEEMGNAGLQDKTWYEKRIEFFREFYNRLPKSDPELILDMKVDEAKTYFLIGQADQGDRMFQTLTEEYPNDPDLWLAWADAWVQDDSPVKDFDRAMAICNQALERFPDYANNIFEHQEDLKSFADL